VKRELEYNNLIRISYSSSKTGVHIKVNKTNNLIENLYYRTYFNDDLMRVRQDMLRANNSDIGFTYDIAFKYKTNKLIKEKKDFILIDYKTILNNCSMKKNTFYKLIKYIQLQNMLKVNLVLIGHKTKSLIQNNPLGIEIINPLRNKHIESINELNDNEELMNKFKSLLNKYANKNTKSLTNNYSTNLPLELCKSIYRLSKEK
jgi:hypothetical protein